jgi:hypothetical protein
VVSSTAIGYRQEGHVNGRFPCRCFKKWQSYKFDKMPAVAPCCAPRSLVAALPSITA